MADTVIFIDGEYARKIFINTGYKLNIPKLIDMGVDGNDNRKLTTCANRILTTPNMIAVQ